MSAIAKLPVSYYKLVRAFPLAHLRNDRELTAAQQVLDRLLAQDLDDGARAYADVLTDLIEAYENEHERMPDASESDVLRELMHSHGLTQPALAKKVGISQSTISAVLTGARSLTKNQIVRLCKFFNVTPATFLPA